MVTILIGVLSLTGFFVSRSAGRANERALLRERAGEVAAVLSSGVRSTVSSLRLIGELYANGTDPAASSATARSLVVDNVTGIGIASVTTDAVVVRTFEGTGHAQGEALTQERADLIRRALTVTNLVTARVTATATTPSTYIVAIGRQDGSVVFRESTIDTSVLPTSIDPTSFKSMSVSLYRTTTEDPANLILTANGGVPTGLVDRRLIAIGAEQWLLLTSARGSLGGDAQEELPWLILIGGLGAAVLTGAVVDLLARRRQYALELVDERTDDLRRTMTQLEEARRFADASNHSKSEFLSRMSHELRTPLNAVLGFTQLLEMGELDEGQREAVGHILKGGTHLLNLINEVLDISRIESGDIVLSPEPVLVDEVVAETLDLMRPIAANTSVRFVSEHVTSCNCYVFADRQRLKQVLLNLVSNAIKYNVVGGTVAVTCRQLARNRVRISVADTGPGIRPEQLGLLFTPFERLGAERSNVEGTGIGLALSRRLAEAMEGTLEVETTYGSGSTFSIELSLVEGPVERNLRLGTIPDPAVADVDEPPAPRHPILYIEDNLANLTLVETIFRGRGDIALLPASHGRLGLELARQHLPVAILLDLHLPDMPGDEVLEQLRDDPLTATIPVIVVSADATLGHIQRLKSAGALAYLTKPFNVRELLDVVDSVVAQASERNGHAPASRRGYRGVAGVRGAADDRAG